MELQDKTFFGFAFGTANFLMNDFNWEDVDGIVSGRIPIYDMHVKTLILNINGRKEKTKVIL